MNITRVHGGLLNRMWRFDTDHGSFAVKELNNDRGWTYRHDDIFRFEQAAFAAGIPMPEPVAANETVLIHRWVDGEVVPTDRAVSPACAEEIGGVLARLHALDAPWTHVSIPDPMPTEQDWRALADLAPGQPWGEALAEIVPVLGAIGRFVDEVGEPEPIVLSHSDIGQKNLLSVDGHPVLVDWEITKRIPLAWELGSTALVVACGDVLQEPDTEVFRAVLEGYVAAGGTLPDPGRHWFADQLSGQTWFLRWNVKRCIAGVEPTNGPGLEVAHDCVRSIVNSIPTLFASIDRLTELTSLR